MTLPLGRYSRAAWQSVVCRMVLRMPSRMVPPMCVRDPSGMKMMAGSGHASSNSALFASSRPSTLRAYSMTATCMCEGGGD